MNGSVAGEVVVEAVLDRRADGDLGARIEFLHGLGHHVRRVVPDEADAVRRCACHDLDRRVRVDRQVQVAQFPVDLDAERVGGQPLADRSRHLAPGCPSRIGPNAAVRQSQGDFSAMDLGSGHWAEPVIRQKRERQM